MQETALGVALGAGRGVEVGVGGWLMWEVPLGGGSLAIGKRHCRMYCFLSCFASWWSDPGLAYLKRVACFKNFLLID